GGAVHGARKALDRTRPWRAGLRRGERSSRGRGGGEGDRGTRAISRRHDFHRGAAGALRRRRRNDLQRFRSRPSGRRHRRAHGRDLRLDEQPLDGAARTARGDRAARPRLLALLPAHVRHRLSLPDRGRGRARPPRVGEPRRVKVLVQTQEPRGRLALAARGLALRGHVVGWSGAGGGGGPAPPWRLCAEVVATDEGRPLRSTFRGALAGARCLVAALSYDAVSRWGAVEHWAWSMLSPLGLVEPNEAPAFQAAPRGLALDRLGLWSDEAPPAEPDPAHPDVEVLERACERAIARHRSRAPRAAAFLDRDGTLVPDTGYLADPNDLQLFPGTAAALRTIAA